MGIGWIERALAERENMPVRGDVVDVLPKKKKELPVKHNFTYNPIRSFREANPYDIAFCYPHPLYHKPFIVKGGHQDVRKYLKNLNMPIIAHHTLYRKNKHRRVFGLYGIDKDISIRRDYQFNEETGRYKKETRYKLCEIKRNKYGLMKKEKVLAKFRRVPRRWIRELNLYVTVKRRKFHGT